MVSFFGRLILCGTVICTSSILSFQLGIESISVDYIKKHNLHTSSVGLITNQTGCTQTGQSSLSVLRKKGVQIKIIFAPEHGYTGKGEAGKTVKNEIEAISGSPIVSLYSHEHGLVGKSINKEKLQTIDALIFDMQDSGMRHYTYISTLMRVMEAAALYKKKIFVLDRPNLLGPIIEGPLVDQDLISFISIAPIPLRHGMTIGEIARYFNQYILNQPADLYVVPMANYTRQELSHLYAPLSPNLQTLQACYGYSFLGMLGEVQPFNVGVGTPQAFQCITLPRSKKISDAAWKSVQQLLNQYHIKNLPYTFFNERKKEYCDGLRIEIPHISMVHSFELFLRLVALFQKHGVVFTYSTTFDKAIGSGSMRPMIQKSSSLEAIKKTYTQQLTQFYQQALPLFLYEPYPYIV